MIKWIDKHISKYLPKWVVNVGVSATFSLVPAVGLGFVLALVNLDLSMLWSEWPRGVFAGLTVLFTTFLMVSK